MKTFKSFLNAERFTCDSCQVRFYEKTAYSVASDWEEFDHYPTFCFKCIQVIKKTNQPKKDKRTLNKTGRTYQLGARVRKEFLKKLKRIAYKEKLKYVEVLEKALNYYAERKK